MEGMDSGLNHEKAGRVSPSGFFEMMAATGDRRHLD
jgi:hypothetical protein